MNRLRSIIATLCGTCVCLTYIHAQQATVQHVTLQGHVGDEITKCIEQQVKKQDVHYLVEPFRHHEETHRWQTEFWGKWIQGAIDSYRYNHDEQLLDSIRTAANLLMDTQLKNGYIGNYSEEAQLRQWDVWGRKYTCLGLLKWHDLSGDKKALKAAERLINHLLTQVGPEAGKKQIVHTGNYFGMASSSILEPIVYLYQHTGNKRYLDFANYIVTAWEKVEGGPLLFSKADEPVAHRFPAVDADEWFSPKQGHKAYEMMSCYEGLIELGKETGNKQYLEIAEKVARHIIDEEINITGSGSSFECWYEGYNRQTLPTYHNMETCVTFTWMQFCNRLLKATRNVLYADEIERTFYNALFASIKQDGSVIAKYTPLEGVRTEGEGQCNMLINCCTANAPRAFAMIPHSTYITDGDNRVTVNFYIPGKAEISLPNKNQLTLTQTTEYPKDNQITMQVELRKEATFPIALRIPAWTQDVQVKINGEPISGTRPGSYFEINREWHNGDQISLTLEMQTRLVQFNNCQAIVRGPITFARDSRFNEGYVDEASVIQNSEGKVDARLVECPDWAWITIEVPMIMGTALEKAPYNEVVMKRLCNFSSAGNTWDHNQRYRVWLPQTFDARKKNP